MFFYISYIKFYSYYFLSFIIFFLKILCQSYTALLPRLIGTQGSAFRNLPVSRDLNIDGGDLVRLRKFVISFVMDNVSSIHLCIINLGKAIMY